MSSTSVCGVVLSGTTAPQGSEAPNFVFKHTLVTDLKADVKATANCVAGCLSQKRSAASL